MGRSCWKLGYDIEGLLQHNFFIAEKAATRAYVSRGIIKYYQAVREKARYVSPVTYFYGDMSLALRLLSTEYAQPHKNQSQGSGNQCSNIHRPGSSQIQPIRSHDNRQSNVVGW